MDDSGCAHNIKTVTEAALTMAAVAELEVLIITMRSHTAEEHSKPQAVKGCKYGIERYAAK